MATVKPDQLVQLHEGSDQPVMLTTADSDRFVKTQREIVSAMRGADDMIARGREVTEQFNSMAADIRAWCLRQGRVQSCVLAPRADDILVVVVAKDEDEDGSLDDAISAIDLEMFSRNRFRLSWLMFRASEASGVRAFFDPRHAKTLYSA